MSRPLTVIIPTFNEADNIRAAIASVNWADEIIVVDSYSTDQTVEIAQELGAKVLQRPYLGPADQKNWAIPKASHEWVLLLDADERIRLTLRQEIQELLASEAEIPYDAFQIKRRNFFMGKKIRFSGWRGDRVIRLIRRDVCRYNDKQVHEEIMTEGIRLAALEHKMNHFTFKDLDHFLDKMRRYATWSAQDHAKRTKRVSWYHLWIKPVFRFFKHFFFQLGILDGKVGFIISVIMAWGVFLRYVKLQELRSKEDQSGF